MLVRVEVFGRAESHGHLLKLEVGQPILCEEFRMRRLLYPSILAMLASASGGAFAQDMFDWSGFYVGGAVGVVQSDSHADLVYGTDTEGVTEAWSATDGFFTGVIYDDVDGSSISVGSDGYTLDLDDLTSWLTETDLSQLSWTGMGFAGAQAQFGNFVLGGEVRGVFGDFGNSYHDSWSEDVSDDGTADDAEAATLTASLPSLTDPSPWSGEVDFDSEGILDVGAATIHGDVSQDNSLSFATSYDSYYAPVAKLGLAAERFMLFALAGPAVAQVTATTSASVDENGHVGVSADSNSVADLDGSASYDWSGSNTETLWGYTVGAGVEYAVTDNMIFRFEGSMTDLGAIDVTGSSEDTDAEYTVTQTVGNYALTTGVSLKF